MCLAHNKQSLVVENTQILAMRNENIKIMFFLFRHQSAMKQRQWCHLTYISCHCLIFLCCPACALIPTLPCLPHCTDPGSVGTQWHCPCPGPCVPGTCRATGTVLQSCSRLEQHPCCAKGSRPQHHPLLSVCIPVMLHGIRVARVASPCLGGPAPLLSGRRVCAHHHSGCLLFPWWHISPLSAPVPVVLAGPHTVAGWQPLQCPWRVGSKGGPHLFLCIS